MRLSVPRFLTGLFCGVSQTASHAPGTDASSTPVDVEASYPCKPENGLLGIANLCKHDRMYMNTPKFSNQSMYLLLRKAIQLANLWDELRYAEINKSDNLVEMERTYEDEHYRYLKLTKYVYEIERLEAPYTKFFSNFQAILDYVLSGEEEADLVGRPREDWVMLNGLHPMECLVHNSVEYPAVEFALQKLATKTTTEDGRTILDYPTRSLAGVLAVFKNCIMAAFLGVPVALQALDVTTAGVKVGIYLAALLIFGIVVQFFMEDHTVQTVLTMAYAAVLVANMTPK